MNCHCDEKAFTFTKFFFRDGKRHTSLVGQCNRSLEKNNKRKKKCDFREEKIIEICDLPCEEIKSQPVLVTSKPIETRADHIKDLLTTINNIKTCQETEYPFDKYTNRILYLSKKLNIPPYIQEKCTIEEYYNIAHYYLKNPIPVRKPIPIEKYSLIDYFLESIKNSPEPTNQELCEHFKKLLTIEKRVIKIKPSNNTRRKIVSNGVGKFKTGGTDDKDLVQEDELDVEEFDSEEEQDDYDDHYKSD